MIQDLYFECQIFMINQFKKKIGCGFSYIILVLHN